MFTSEFVLQYLVDHRLSSVMRKITRLPRNPKKKTLIAAYLLSQKNEFNLAVSIFENQITQ